MKLKVYAWFDLAVRIATAMVGYHLHGSVAWAIVDLIFWPIAITKWLICHEVNATVVRETFSFLLQ